MAISSNKVILKNTLMLYFRQILTLFVSLYTVRIVLDVLGVEDYGIFQVIGGVVLFFSFLKGTMASATQRFFSFAMGEEDEEKLKKIFSINLIIYVFIGVLALILLEGIGLWFVRQELNIPAERFNSALLVYHFTVLSFFFTIVSTPFISALMAHEDMHIFAYISIAEAILKLVIVFLLMHLSFDKLELYGFLLLVVSVLICFTYVWIGFKRYKECQFRIFYWNNKMFKEIIGFTGWTLFGSFTSAARYQGVIILINQFYNPVVVAAVAVARNITGQVQMFSVNFNSSLYPPIIKSYAAKDLNNMFNLIFAGSKMTFYLLWIFALPLFLGMDVILELWLKEVPEWTVLLSRLALVEVLINSISLPAATAARAPGKMKMYELSLGAIQIAIFLFSWLFLSMGSPVYIVFVIAIIANLVMFLVRLVILRYLIGIPLKSFFGKVVVPVFAVMLLSTPVSYFLVILLPKGIIYSLIALALCFVVVTISVYFVGLDKAWRDKIKVFIISKLPLKNNL
jgi:O-antigen/teichoic acid export membrane protein